MKTYELPELEYGYRDLEPWYSSELLELHHCKHHAAYVQGANATLEDLEAARKQGDYACINQLQKNVAFHLSGHVLHSILWKNIGPAGGGEPQHSLADAIRSNFGSFGEFREQMSAAAIGIQGSGWASLAWDPLGRRLVVEQVHDHQGNIGSATLPLLVLDMWEHAYYLQHKNDRQSWIEAYWQIVDWADVQRRFDALRKTDLALA